MNDYIIVKHGDTLEINCGYQDHNGNALSLDGIAVKSQIKDASGHLIDEFDITVTNEAGGEYTMIVVDTSSWSVGAVYKYDIQYSYDGKRSSTCTGFIKVVEDITE